MATLKVELSAEVLGSFAYFSSMLVLKMLTMSLLTAVQRFKKRVFANPEDVAHDKKNLRVQLDDPDVERVRRAHLNDMENILPFFHIGLMYCFTNPSLYVANWLFKIFTLARFAHTVFYALVPRQPQRALLWSTGMFINVYMSYKVLIHFL